jgi:hypothetical protein
MFVPRAPFAGKTLIDAQPVRNALCNIAPGSRRKLKRTRDGVAYVIAELRSALVTHGALLGLSAAEIVQRLDSHAQNVKDLRSLLGDVAELHAAIEQSLAVEEDALEAEIAAVAVTVKRHGTRRDPAVKVPFEKTLDYHGQSAQKGVATRRKNQEEQSGKLRKGKAKKRNAGGAPPMEGL